MEQEREEASSGWRRFRADLIQGSRVGREVAEKRRIAYMGNASSYR